MKRKGAVLSMPAVSVLFGCAVTPYEPPSTSYDQPGSYLVGYGCSTTQEEAYGKVTVAVDVSVQGRFERGVGLLRTRTGESPYDNIEVGYQLSDENLIVPAAPSYLRVSQRIEAEPTKIITLFVTVNSGERFSDFVIDASAARENRRNSIGSGTFTARGFTSDGVFLGAFQRASSVAIDVIDADGKALGHKVLQTNIASVPDVMNHLAAEVKEKMLKPKVDCRGTILNVD